MIHALHPTARIVDLTHQVAPQAIREGAFLLHAACPYFPPESIHVAVVDPGYLEIYIQRCWCACADCYECGATPEPILRDFDDEEAWRELIDTVLSALIRRCCPDDNTVFPCNANGCVWHGSALWVADFSGKGGTLCRGRCSGGRREQEDESNPGPCHR